MEKINGIIKDGRVYELSEGGCFKCEFFTNRFDDACPVKELCTIMPYPEEGKDNCFRYSPYLTERLNNPKTKDK